MTRPFCTLTKRDSSRSVLLLALLLMAAGCAGHDDGPDDGARENVFLSGRVLNIAHRGGNRIAPEHTFPAFESALAIGADVLEMDFRVTSDGILVLMHDQTVDRTTNGTGRVEAFTLDEIRTLDAGYDFTRDGGATYPYRGQGLVVLQLAEVLERFRGVPMNIEIKAENPPSVIPTFVELLDRFDMRTHVLVASFSDALVQGFRAAAPDVLTSFAPFEATQFFVLTSDQEASYTPPALFLQVPPTYSGIPVLNEAFVAKAHRHGLFVHGWDVDDLMRETIALGVDGLIVDDPAALEALLPE
jgi:glycerophosphoryl diester phosphodiesterase